MVPYPASWKEDSSVDVQSMGDDVTKNRRRHGEVGGTWAGSPVYGVRRANTEPQASFGPERAPRDGFWIWSVFSGDPNGGRLARVGACMDLDRSLEEFGDDPRIGEQVRSGF